jgi:hypothetical protein
MTPRFPGPGAGETPQFEFNLYANLHADNAPLCDPRLPLSRRVSSLCHGRGEGECEARKWAAWTCLLRMSVRDGIGGQLFVVLVWGIDAWSVQIFLEEIDVSKQRERRMVLATLMREFPGRYGW